MEYDDRKVPQSGGRAVAGVYSFYVGDAIDQFFKTGNPGVTLTLMTAAFPNRDVKVTTRLVTVKSALWKVNEFLQSVGVPFSPPPPTESLIGKRGRAEFVLDDKGYLEVKSFLPASANNGPDSRPSDDLPPF